MTEKLLLDNKETAKLLGVSVRTLFDLTHPRGPLRVVRIKTCVRYSRGELERFIKQQIEQN